jgi:hypothetical protein
MIVFPQVLKVAILAEKYAVDYTWYVDVILNLIRIAGDYVSEEVCVYTGHISHTRCVLFPCYNEAEILVTQERSDLSVEGFFFLLKIAWIC